ALANLPIPPEYKAEWTQTDAGQRLAHWQEEADDLERAAREIREGDQQLIRDGQKVLDDRNKSFLPRRAKEGLDRAQKLNLTDPKVDRDKPITADGRLTYVIVFQFEGVSKMYREWEDIKMKLEKPAKLEMP